MKRAIQLTTTGDAHDPSGAHKEATDTAAGKGPQEEDEEWRSLTDYSSRIVRAK